MGRFAAFARPRFLENFTGPKEANPCRHSLNRSAAAIGGITSRQHQQTGTQTLQNMHSSPVTMTATEMGTIETNGGTTQHSDAHP